jgi:hypothetical protein
MDDTMKVEKADIEDIDSLVELRLDSKVKYGTVLGLISFLTIPILMISMVIRRNRITKNDNQLLSEDKRRV